jgi:hypothetical protein
VKAYIVSEGPFGAQFLHAILPHDLLRGVEFVPCKGTYDATTMASSLLAARRTPVALVVDSDTTDSESIQERRITLRDLLMTAAAGIPFAAILAVPEIEAVLFQDPALLRNLFGDGIPERTTWIARYEPRTALEELFQRSSLTKDRSRLLNALDAVPLDALRQAEPIRELSNFLQLVTADRAICEVSRGPNSARIEYFRAFLPVAGIVGGQTSDISRPKLIEDIEGGKKVITVYRHAGQWRLGAAVHVTSKGYLRTDRNDVEEDNLGDLPEFSWPHTRL